MSIGYALVKPLLLVADHNPILVRHWSDIGSANVNMSEEEFEEINKILATFPKAGDRCTSPYFFQ